MHRAWSPIVGVAALFLFLATVSSGQQLATLNVNVTDQSGGAIPKPRSRFKAPKPARKGTTHRTRMVSRPSRDCLPETTSYWSVSLSLARAQQHGATDKEIHDAVLIAAGSSMYNRYVDGLATWRPRERDAYRDMGKQLAHEGYLRDRFQDDQKAPQA